MQLTFSPGAINFRYAGVSIYNDALPNSSEYVNLFDQYRVRGVSVRIDYDTNMFSNSGVAYSPPLCLFVLDHDDPNDAAVADLLQFPQVITHAFTEGGYKPFIATFNPRPLVDVAGAGVTTGYSPMKTAPYIRTSEMSIPHYGMKMAILSQGASVSATIGYFQVTTFMDLEFINPK